MVNQTVAELFGNLALECLQFRIDEFDDFACLNVDQMIVVSLGRGFITGAAIAEIVAIEDPGLFEQPHGTIDRGNRNPGVNCDRALMQFLDVGVVIALRKHPRDDTALLGYAKPACCAKRLNIDRMVHSMSE